MNNKKFIMSLILTLAGMSLMIACKKKAETSEQNSSTQTSLQASASSVPTPEPQNQRVSNPDPPSQCGAEDPNCQKPTQPAHYVIAYYFHTTHRCYTCLKIEQYTREAIEAGFGPELKAGGLKFFSVNVEEPMNRHFIQDYQLYTKSLILVEMENGRQKQWKNLNQIWIYVRDKSNFIKYVQDEIRSLL